MILSVKTIKGISRESHFAKTNEYIQHGSTTCLRHTLAVAHYSLMTARALKFFGINCKTADLVRGALLHDYFLYDWHKSKNHFHGFTHPSTSLNNACEDFELTETEKNIIVRHMFPLTIIPPTTREAWIVCAVDKWCSLCETFLKQPYKDISRQLRVYEKVAGLKDLRP